MDLVWLKVLRNSCTVPYLFFMCLDADLATGEQQQIFDIVLNVLVIDCYVLLLRPLYWVLDSRRHNWQGYTVDRRHTERYCYLLRSPDLLPAPLALDLVTSLARHNFPHRIEFHRYDEHSSNRGRGRLAPMPEVEI